MSELHQHPTATPPRRDAENGVRDPVGATHGSPTATRAVAPRLAVADYKGDLHPPTPCLSPPRRSATACRGGEVIVGTGHALSADPGTTHASPQRPVAAVGADGIRPPGGEVATDHGGNAPARIGPNALIQTVAALRETHDDPRVRAILQRSGQTALLTEDPAHMVNERDVTRLVAAVTDALGPDAARQIMHRSGTLTAGYLLRHRIPGPFQRLLKLRIIPRRAALHMLLFAISKHAWTFAGSGAFTYTVGARTPTVGATHGSPTPCLSPPRRSATACRGGEVIVGTGHALSAIQGTTPASPQPPAAAVGADGIRPPGGEVVRATLTVENTIHPSAIGFYGGTFEHLFTVLIDPSATIHTRQIQNTCVYTVQYQ